MNTSPDVTALIRSHMQGRGSDDRMEALRLQLRQKCKDDLWFFAYHCCNYRDIESKLHLDMCKRWMARAHRLFSLWLIPRSHLKTSLWTEAGSLWELIKDPHIRILIVNAKLDNARGMLANIRNIVETNDVFRWLFPEFCFDLAPKLLRDRCKWTETRIDFPNSSRAGQRVGNVECMSVGASLVSKHYELILFDDPVNDENTTTKDYRDKIFKWYKDALQLRVDLTSRIRLIGTRWHFDDLYSRVIRRENSTRKKQRESGEQVTPNFLIYRREVIEGGKPIWPERFSLEGLAELKIDLGNYIYSCQYLNNPIPEEDAHFKISQIKPIADLFIPTNVNNFVAVDLADEETTRGDYCAITVASFDDSGKMYVREIQRGHFTILDMLEKIQLVCNRWDPLRVGIEITAFQKAIYKFYKRDASIKGYNIPWDERERGKTSKFKRTLGLQPRVERGDFFYEENMENHEWMIEEMTTFPLSTHDDILDTLVDLEAMFYAAPKVVSVVLKEQTYDDAFGNIFGDEPADEAMDCSFIGKDLV